MREPPLLGLFIARGEVFSIKSFVRRHMGLLEPHEQFVVASCLDTLPDDDGIPPEARTVLARNRWLSDKGESVSQVRRRGARNAFWPERELLFKGCRPVQGPADFPDESIPWGEDRIHYSRIPFGVLTAEGVMREILGHCFFHQCGLPLRSVPVCVYRYMARGQSFGYCLVLKTSIENRIEALIEYPDMALSDLIVGDIVREKTGVGEIFSGEARLHHANVRAYAETKARMLALMNQRGGFRGLLNSNIGNDVVAMRDGVAAGFFLCDFDTFRVIRIPPRPGRQFKRAFLLQCLVEVVKGSLPIIDYVYVDSRRTSASFRRRAREIYFSESSLWQAYMRRLDAVAAAVGYGSRSVRALIAEICDTEAFMVTLLDQVVNYTTMRKSPPPAQSMYTPHD